jgi:Bacterial regulatory helix-turn-helix protein, lysR family
LHSSPQYIDLLDIFVVIKTTLDGREILQILVRIGGFAPAAEQLNCSQSMIAYAIARLREQLGKKLYEQKARRAHLTQAGRILKADAGKLHDIFDRYGIANSFEIYPGSHASAVADRF